MSKKKKALLIVLDIIILVIALSWTFWLVFYFGATIDGPILITGKANIFERNYLVPIQTFAISALIIATTIVLYVKLLRKKRISKKYLTLVFLNILPFLYLTFAQIEQMVYYWDWIY